MLVENTREEALKAFLNGSDVRVVIKTPERHARFLDLRKLLPPDAVYFVNIEIKPEDDYGEKVLSANPGGDSKTLPSTEQEVSVTERKHPKTKTKPPVTEQKAEGVVERIAKPKRKTAKDIIEPYVKQGLTDSEIAEKTGVKYTTVWNAAKKIREKLEETKGKNADRHLCKTCQYRAASYDPNSQTRPRCEYSLKPGTENSRGCDVEDCDKYVKGKPLRAKGGIEI